MRLFGCASDFVSDPFLRRAFDLAFKAQGLTSPNPTVGCVVVSEGAVVGEGYHPSPGEPHAEVVALRRAGDRARGATAYVTLEPCNHHGKTPPCVDALISAGVSRVVIGMLDPNPVASGGVNRLREAGIAVDVSEDPLVFESLNEGWLKRLRNGRALLTVKLGLSLDARLSTAPGVRVSVTGEDGARVTQDLRSRCDAIVIGASTADTDDPALTLRGERAALRRQPERVILVRDHLPRTDLKMYRDGGSLVTILVPEDASAAVRAGISAIPPGVRILKYGGGGLADLARDLAGLGYDDVLVEPGPRLFTSLVEARAYDALVTVTAGTLAGAAATGLYGGTPHMAGSSTLASVVVPLESGLRGGCVVTQWRPVAHPGAGLGTTERSSRCSQA